MHKTSLLALYVLFPLLLTGLLLGCSRSELDFSVSDLPPGDPSHGAELFTQRVGSTASCASCHPLEGRAGAGPSLAGYGDYAAGRAGKQTPE
jgi:mono/diheme cytochrome c family protein